MFEKSIEFIIPPFDRSIAPGDVEDKGKIEDGGYEIEGMINEQSIFKDSGFLALAERLGVSNQKPHRMDG
ncbi:MAG: hypothetical protein ACLR8P_13670 [Clostridium fessum]